MGKTVRKKPNIVYFFCDELRCDALSCYHDAREGIKTFNIDEMAAMGTVFENCYSNSPVCVPSRYSIMTGLYPEATGVYHNEAAKRQDPQMAAYITIPQVLKEYGYRTANFGKQHLPQGVEPFEHHEAEGGHISHSWVKDCKAVVVTKGIASPIGGEFPENVKFPAETVTENAMAWIKEQTEPFMVRISWLQPHTPVLTPSPYSRVYEELSLPELGKEDAHLSQFEKKYIENVQDGLTEEEAHWAKVCYYGMVRWVDDQVGRILDVLKKKGILNNTILVFGADHGVMLGENHRYAKQNFSCWSQRVPLILAYDGFVEKGVRRWDLCENLDLGKTLFSLIGISAPDQFCGRALFSEKSPEFVYGSIGYGEPESYTFPNKKHGRYLKDRGWPRRACIRSVDYRLDMNIQIDGESVIGVEEDIFLADLKKDPWEQYNLADDETYWEIREVLRGRLLAHIEEQIPV